MAAVKKKPKKQSMNSFLKELRGLLGKGSEVVRDKNCSGIQYLVDGMFTIKLNYYCSVGMWDEEGRKKELARKTKECHPVSVVVKINQGRFNEWCKKNNMPPVSAASVFGARTYGRRVDNTINLESVAIAITKGKEAIKDYRKHYLAAKKKRDEFEKKCKRLHKEVINGWKGTFDFKGNFGDVYVGKAKVKDSRATVEVRVYAEEEPESYALDIDGLTQPQLDQLLEHCAKL